MQDQTSIRPRHRTRGVFLGPMEVAGYFARLRLGFEAIGIPTTYVDLEGHPFSYPEAPPPNIVVRVARAITKRLAHSETRARRTFWKGLSIAIRLVMLCNAVIRCDLFIFGSGQTLFGFRETWLLRLLRKRIIVVFFGTDLRPSYLDGIEARAPNATPVRLRDSTRAKRDRARRAERIATAIVSHGPMSQLLSRDYAAWLLIGIPTVSASTREPRYGPGLRVLHAPSNIAAKGTEIIRGVVERLRTDGVAIDYRELTSTSNERVQEAIRWADVVVDQLYSDTPMAVLASEAAAAGVPSIVGSLDWEAVTAEIDPLAVPPSIRIHPDELSTTLRDMAAAPDRGRDIGLAARAFVAARWSPASIARRYLALADGSAPASWFRSPQSTRYAGGIGLTRHELRDVLASMATAISEDPYLVSDNPALVERLRGGGVEDPL